MSEPKNSIRKTRTTPRRSLNRWGTGDEIKNIDILGERLKMSNSKESSRFRTRIGGFITILVSSIALVSLVLIVAQYFDTSSPVVTTSLELSRTAQSLNIYNNELISGISVSFNNIFEPMKMDKYLTIICQVVQKSFDPSTNSTKIDLSKKFSYIPCSYLEKDDPAFILLKKVIGDNDFRPILCPNFKEAENYVPLSYDPENLSSSSLIMKVYPCSLRDPTECYPMTKIFGAELTSTEILNLISPSNYTNPVAFRWIHPRYFLDITRTKSFRYILQQTKIIDDRHFLGKPELKKDYGSFKLEATDNWPRDMTQLHCSVQMIEAGECEEYLEFVYEMSLEERIVTRRYKKLPALLGEAGGILKLLTSVFVVVSLIYSRWVAPFLFEKAFNIELKTLVEAKKNDRGRGKKECFSRRKQ